MKPIRPNFFYNPNWKNKETGEIVSVISFCSDDTITVIGSGGVQTKFNTPHFLDQFEEVEVNYREYSSQIAEACYLYRDVSKVADSVLRRLTPNYFEVGCYVYFVKNYTSKAVSLDYEFKIERPFKVVGLIEDKDNSIRSNDGLVSNIIWVNLVRGHRRVETKFDFDIQLPIYTDQISNEDAYSYLKRYDKPY